MKLKDYFIGLIIVIAFMLAIIYEPKATIFIINEYDAVSSQGPCKVVEYSIGAVMQIPAVFYGTDSERYDKFMKELENEGRVIR